MSGISSRSTLRRWWTAHLVYYLSACHDIAALRKVSGAKSMMLVLVEVVIWVLRVVWLLLMLAARLLLVYWASAILRWVDTHLVLHHIAHVLLALGLVLMSGDTSQRFWFLCWGNTSLSCSMVSTTRWKRLLLETLVMRVELHLTSVPASMFFALGRSLTIHLGHLCLNLSLCLRLVHTLAHQHVHQEQLLLIGIDATLLQLLAHLGNACWSIVSVCVSLAWWNASHLLRLLLLFGSDTTLHDVVAWLRHLLVSLSRAGLGQGVVSALGMLALSCSDGHILRVVDPISVISWFLWLIQISAHVTWCSSLTSILSWLVAIVDYEGWLVDVQMSTCRRII